MLAVIERERGVPAAIVSDARDVRGDLGDVFGPDARSAAAAAKEIAEAGQREAERLAVHALGLLAVDRDHVAASLRLVQAPDRVIVALEPLVLVADLRASVDLVEHGGISRRLLRRRCLRRRRQSQSGDQQACENKAHFGISHPSPDHPRLVIAPLSARCRRSFEPMSAKWTDRRSLLAAGAGLAVAPTLAGCANSSIIGLDKAARSLDICNQGEPISLDPHKCNSSWENNIIGNMFVGLITEDQHSHPIPGMAERWETSDDGLTWTFFLRPAQWSDGQPCNAHDFEFAFRRILDPANLAVYASFLYAIKNAEAINNGRMHPDQAARQRARRSDAGECGSNIPRHTCRN